LFPTTAKCARGRDGNPTKTHWGMMMRHWPETWHGGRSSLGKQRSVPQAPILSFVFRLKRGWNMYVCNFRHPVPCPSVAFNLQHICIIYVLEMRGTHTWAILPLKLRVYVCRSRIPISYEVCERHFINLCLQVYAAWPNGR